MMKRVDRLVSPLSSQVGAWVCALMISLCVMKAIQARPRVAVLELRDYASLSTFELKSVTQLLRGAVARDGRYLVLTQENITALLPSELRLEDCEGSCEVETGRTLGVALTMTGEVGRIDGDLSLMLRLRQSLRPRLRLRLRLAWIDVKGDCKTEAEVRLSESDAAMQAGCESEAEANVGTRY